MTSGEVFETEKLPYELPLLLRFCSQYKLSIEVVLLGNPKGSGLMLLGLGRK